jgi:hypothetical protein
MGHERRLGARNCGDGAVEIDGLRNSILRNLMESSRQFAGKAVL